MAMMAPRGRARPGCRAPVAFGVALLVSVLLCCGLGLVSGAVIGELTGGVLSRDEPLAQRRSTVRARPRPTARRLAALTPTLPAPPAEQSVEAVRSPIVEVTQPAAAPAAPPASTQELPASSPAAQAAAQPAVGLPADQPARSATRLSIPALGVDTPVVLIGLQNGTWEVDRLTQEVGHMQGTASPGDASNVAIAGHVTLAQGGDGPFRYLAALTQGDEVLVFVGEQPYRYLIEQVRVVSPEDVQVTFPTANAVLTLITCANWNRDRHVYDDRIIAVARLAP